MRFALPLLVLALVASGCAQLLANRSGEVTGTVTYLERIALSPDAVVEVTLEDVSLQDMPAAVLDRQTIRPQGQQVPIPFRLRYDPLRLNTAHTYAVRARITEDGQLRWISDTHTPVITQGHPVRDVEVRVRQVSG
ncbi:MAG: YbaY family lipoprotein [Rubricoccaceae bacterium]